MKVEVKEEESDNERRHSLHHEWCGWPFTWKTKGYLGKVYAKGTLPHENPSCHITLVDSDEPTHLMIKLYQDQKLVRQLKVRKGMRPSGYTMYMWSMMFGTIPAALCDAIETGTPQTILL